MASDVDFGALERVLGKRLIGASRIVYEHDGVVEVSCGDLELEFSGGDVVLFGVAGDGERLRMQEAAWRDPFAPPLDAENEEYVRESGKHVRLDAREVGPTLPVGESLVRYVAIRNQFGTVAGVRLEFAGSAVRFLVEGDEAYVMTTEDPRFTEWGFTEDDAFTSPAA
ncbi:MAG TPA: hypothetical protein VF179_29945 [Thermoanaerobaculia bacterium]|nr:hypothetical protein [Thermoanaerobaculia bacterium]